MLYSPSHGAKAGLCVTSVAFDTLKFANRLKTAGVPAAHAEAEAEALAEVLEINLQGLAESESKNGKALARLEADMKEGFAQVNTRFAQVDQRFEKIDQRFAQVDQRFEQIAKDFAQLDKNMDQRFAQVDQRFVEIKGEMLLLKWMFGVIVTSLVALIIKAFF
nr:hypothetical protein [Xylella fastidiosa]